MKTRFIPYPYFLGVLVGVTMVTVFLTGYISRVREFYFIGSSLIATGLLLWPIFVLVTLTLLHFHPHKRGDGKRWWWALMIFPVIGGALAVAVFSLIL